MTELNLYGSIEAASAKASVKVLALVPGAVVYVAEVTVDGHARGFRVADMWPDDQWQLRAQARLLGGLGQQVECRVCLVVRKPVEAPQELVRHWFIVGRMPHPITSSPGPA